MSKAGDLLNKVEEVSPEKVLRFWLSSKKKVHKSIVCPPGFVLQQGGCHKFSPLELRKFKKAAKKRLKKLRGKEATIVKKRLRSLERRKMGHQKSGQS